MKIKFVVEIEVTEEFAEELVENCGSTDTNEALSAALHEKLMNEGLDMGIFQVLQGDVVVFEETGSYSTNAKWEL